MKNSARLHLPSCLLFLFVVQAPSALSQVEATATLPVDEIGATPDLVEQYMDHIYFLASPALRGRLPGTPGMETAKNYMQDHFEAVGLKAPYPDAKEKADQWRQHFKFGGRNKLEEASLTLADGTALEQKKEYGVPGWGVVGSAEGDVVFCGYAIEKGPEDSEYVGFAEDVDLTGKVAMILRFEPMDEEGKSQFAERAWSRLAGFAGKFQSVVDRGAIGVLVVNTPGADDRRANRIQNRTSWGGASTSVPVMQITADAASAILAQGGDEGGIQPWVDKANAGGVVQPLNTKVSIVCEGEFNQREAENVIGVLPGKGDLADEVVIIGGHLDHLGLGGFGSRDTRENRGVKIHPGADDNASGCAALILLGESLGKAYEALPEDAHARTIVIIAFSAEEMGLHGAAAYCKDPLYPLEKTSLMINFDMIGRIENHRFSASSLGTAEGLEELALSVEPVEPLVVVPSRGTMMASDHAEFVKVRVPVIFASMDNIHDEYHTSRDTAEAIQPHDAVLATHWVHDMAYAAALRPEIFKYKEPEPMARRRPGGAAPKVVFGVNLGQDDQPLGISMVVEGGSASRAGVKVGDVVTSWQGTEVKTLADWRKLLATHSPGDVVAFEVEREGEKIKMKATMDKR